MTIYQYLDAERPIMWMSWAAVGVTIAGRNQTWITGGLWI